MFSTLFFYFILSGSKEEKDHGFFLGPKDQAIDGIKHIFPLCACGEGFTNDSNVAKPSNPWTGGILQLLPPKFQAFENRS